MVDDYQAIKETSMSTDLTMEGKKEPEKVIIRKRFGEILRQVRKLRGLNICELARKAEVDAGYISRIENGHRNPPQMGVIRRLAKQLNVRVHFLSMVAGHILVDESGNLVTDELLSKRLAKEIEGHDLITSEPCLDSQSGERRTLKDVCDMLADIKSLLAMILPNQ